MLELRDWIATVDLRSKPWLIVGKGPTLDARGRFDLDAYHRVSLNHALNVVEVDVAHIVDVDVVVACADVLADRCRWLLMPRHPHVAQRPGRALLEEHVAQLPVLRELDEQGRLVWYNAATAEPVGDSPVMSLKYFSSEAVLDILGELGARTVRSLGVDGGTTYAAPFGSATLLANGQTGFDVQFQELSRIAKARGIDYRPLVEPMRIFVGVDETQTVAARVLEHSIRRHATGPVSVHLLDDPPARLPRDERNRPRTAFSFNRFRIPELAGYSGRAVYLDADMLVFGDIAELFELPFEGAHVLCTRQDERPAAWATNDHFRPGRQFSVMVLDCDELRWDVGEVVERLDDGSLTYEELMFDLAIVPPSRIADSIPSAWNHLEHFEEGVTKLLHYTVVPTQPWKVAGNPLGDLWMNAYHAAVADSAVPPDDVADAIVHRWVRRELGRVEFVRPDEREPRPAATALTPSEVELAALRRWLDQRAASPVERARRIASNVRSPGDVVRGARRRAIRRLAGVHVRREVQ